MGIHEVMDQPGAVHEAHKLGGWGGGVHGWVKGGNLGSQAHDHGLGTYLRTCMMIAGQGN